MKKINFSMFNFKSKKKYKHSLEDDYINEQEKLETNIDDTEEEEPLSPEEVKKRRTKEIFDWMEVLVTAVIAVVIIFSLFFRVATIDGSSMLYTLVGNEPRSGVVGDRVIITNIAYTPKYGDIVVISRNVYNSASAQNPNQGPIIKRVIAVGGQWVDIDFETATVYVDGKPLDEPYISSYTDTKYDVDFPLYVPEGHVFVLGDNRQNSLDSRSSLIGNNGVIDERYILGRAVYRIYPFNRIGSIENR